MTLDPMPYVSKHSSRHAFPGTLNGERLTLDPRPGYEQDWSKYEH